MDDPNSTRERLSDYAHEAWSGWMRYMFSKAELNADGTWTMPAWAVERWQRQMNTPYADLPEGEKASDRDEADKMLAIASVDQPQTLADLLGSIVVADTDYARRYSLVLQAIALADQLGYKAGFRLDPTEPEWPVVFIELPSGQISWHMPQHGTPWDGHTTAEKFGRIAEFKQAKATE